MGGWAWLILNPTMPCMIIQLQYECLSSAMLCDSCTAVPVIPLEHILLSCAMSVAGVYYTAVNHHFTCCHVCRACV